MDLRSPVYDRCEAVSLRVGTYGTKMGSLMADDITSSIALDCCPETEVPRDNCLLGRELFTKKSRKYFEWVLLFAHIVWTTMFQWFDGSMTTEFTLKVLVQD